MEKGICNRRKATLSNRARALKNAPLDGMNAGYETTKAHSTEEQIHRSTFIAPYNFQETRKGIRAAP